MDVLMDSLRREVERCDSLMGFQVFVFIYLICFFVFLSFSASFFSSFLVLNLS